MQSNREQGTIIGATIIGFALVFGAYLYTNFGATYGPERTNTNAAVVQAVEREPIPVTDRNGNGIEDWKESLALAAPVAIQAANTDTYEPPETVTGQFGVQFFENAIRSKYYGSFGSSPEELAERSAALLAQTAQDKIYDAPDIVVIDTTDDTVHAYGNRLATILTDHNVENSVGEQRLLLQALEGSKQDENVAKIKELATMYESYRDLTLATAVPSEFITEHLDLINAYNALYEDLSAMAAVFEDPLPALMRVKRYEDDALGLGYALKHMYEALVPYVDVFETDDPAFLFASFNFRET